jgi:hypothetical protein
LCLTSQELDKGYLHACTILAQASAMDGRSMT